MTETTPRQIKRAAADARAYSPQYFSGQIDEDAYAYAMRSLCRSEGHVKRLPKSEIKQDNTRNLDGLTNKQAEIVQYLRDNGRSSRIDIVDKFGLTPNGVSSLCRKLRNRGFVVLKVDRGRTYYEATRGVGRPSTTYNRALKIVRELGRPVTVEEIADQLGRSRSWVAEVLLNLVDDGLLSKTVPDGQRHNVFEAVEVIE